MVQKYGRLNNRRRVSHKDQPLTMQCFSENVDDFLALHGDCYAPGAPPVACRVDKKLINGIIPFVAARKNNSLIANKDGAVLMGLQSDRSQQSGIHNVAQQCMHVVMPTLLHALGVGGPPEHFW